jgi:hypothetical protein
MTGDRDAELASAATAAKAKDWNSFMVSLHHAGLG